MVNFTQWGSDKGGICFSDHCHFGHCDFQPFSGRHSHWAFKVKKSGKRTAFNINNLPILNPDIVTAIGLMLLFSSLGFRKGYLTMLLAHIAFCTPYVITSVYPKVRSLDPNLANAAMDLGAVGTGTY